MEVETFVVDQVMNGRIIADLPVGEEFLYIPDGFRRLYILRDKVPCRGLIELTRRLLNNFLQLWNAFILSGIDNYNGDTQFPLQSVCVYFDPFFLGQVHHGERNDDGY